MIRHYIKATPAASPIDPPVGTIGPAWGPVGAGWVLADGAAHKRSAFPALAPLCRRFTSFWRWHLAREFRVPDARQAETWAPPSAGGADGGARSVPAAPTPTLSTRTRSAGEQRA